MAPYLLGRPFKILTDYQTLEYFLEQRISTPTQQKWLLKLLGYNYTLDYRPGSVNIVPDALSQQHEFLALMGLSRCIFDCISDIQAEYSTDPIIANIIKDLQHNPTTHSSFSLHGDLLYYKEGIYVTTTSPWLEEFHSSPSGGYSGYLHTSKRILRNLCWPGLKTDVKSFVASCDTCQRVNYETITLAFSNPCPSLLNLRQI